MPTEESVHYGIQGEEAPWEWLYIATFEDGGNLRLGPNHRFFNVALTHQQHCLRYLRQALNSVDVPEGHNVEHAEHCLSLMREHILCAADVTLEPGDTFSRNFTANRDTGDRVCMDAEAFYHTMWTHWNAWLSYEAEIGEVANTMVSNSIIYRCASIHRFERSNGPTACISRVVHLIPCSEACTGNMHSDILVHRPPS